MANDHYSSFVHEAFIAPIRSVLIIDDDYPTFEEMLDQEVAAQRDEPFATEKAWRKNPERIREVIRGFRKSERPLVVDIHDGSNVGADGDVKVAEHLHQSDFLVLDYQLDRTKSNDGTQAIEIIRKLASNKHFNLVLLHTSTNLDNVFEDVRLGLMSLPKEERNPAADDEALHILATTADEIRDGLTKEILASIAKPQYIAYRYDAQNCMRLAITGGAPFVDFKRLADEAGINPGQAKKVLSYALSRTEKDLAGLLNTLDIPLPEYSSGSIKWIRTERIFVAFCNKDENQDLITKLLDALNDWRPPPSRLYLAKLRAEMDEHGVQAQDLALGHRHALAHWYQRLLESSTRERKTMVAESVQRHSDELLAAILPKVVDYANRLVDAEIAGGEKDRLTLQHFNVDLTDQTKRTLAYFEHNAFVCSKPPVGWHLTTGHVFVLGDEHWVCLSPACDTVPTQLSKAKRRSFGNRLPFVAVRLIKQNATAIPQDINSNRYIFLRIGSDISCFSFNVEQGSVPHWRMFYADQEGELTDCAFNVFITSNKEDQLVYERVPSKVVSQLRYEYALNLIQRLGTALTRIGLDFTGSEAEE